LLSLFGRVCSNVCSPVCCSKAWKNDACTHWHKIYAQVIGCALNLPPRRLRAPSSVRYGATIVIWRVLTMVENSTRENGSAIAGVNHDVSRYITVSRYLEIRSDRFKRAHHNKKRAYHNISSRAVSRYIIVKEEVNKTDFWAKSVERFWLYIYIVEVRIVCSFLEHTS